MGYKIAEVASKRGNAITLISGPTRLKPPRVKRFISIETAGDLFKALKKEIKKADCLVMCAAVADFRRKGVPRNKIKRKKALTLRLTLNKDILKALSRHKKSKLFVGFSLETEGVVRNARKKIKNKNLDIIVANMLSKDHKPFGDNKLDVCIIEESGHSVYIKGKSKTYIAQVLLDKIQRVWYLKRKD